MRHVEKDRVMEHSTKEPSSGFRYILYTFLKVVDATLTQLLRSFERRRKAGKDYSLFKYPHISHPYIIKCFSHIIHI